jgi:hypothetical protein
LFSLRSDVEVLFLRTGGLLAQEQADGTISNLYNYQMINKTADSLNVEFKMLDPEVGTFEIIGGKKPAVGKNSKSEGAILLKYLKISSKVVKIISLLVCILKVN